MKIIGAYDKQNNNYIFPQHASKKRKYYCPDCGEDLIFKKGSIVIPHFSHKSNSKCTYYDHPNESQIHKDAKNKLAQWLQDKKPLKLKTKCSSCNGPCKNKKIKYKDNDKVIVEYISQCKKYIADVAIINDDNVRYVLEVTNTHRTIDNAAEVRPEPWFDISADEIVNTDFDKKKVKLNCIRTDCSRFCNDCILICKESCYEEPWEGFKICSICKKSWGDREPCVYLKNIKGKVCINCDAVLYIKHTKLYNKQQLKYKCIIEFCKNKKENKSEYCIDHICKKNECNLNSEKNSFCLNHKCQKYKCKFEKESKSDYCIEHKCSKSKCFLEKDQNNDYCIKHICNKKNCNLVVKSKKYCIEHQYCIIQDVAIKNNKKICKNITNGCYEYVNNNDKFCIICKRIEEKIHLDNISALDFI
jgi:hypothetical protein